MKHEGCNCKECPYWNPLSDLKVVSEEAGECRCATPETLTHDTVPHEMRSAKLGQWPLTLADDWCGMHPDIRTQIAEAIVNDGIRGATVTHAAKYKKQD